MSFTDCAGITPAANMSSTVEDLARFAMLQFRDRPVGGRQVLKGSTLREMQRVHWLDPSWQKGWGLGFVVRRREERTLVEHGGAVPGYRTQVSICPADKLAFIVLTNADDGDPADYVEQAYTLVAPALCAAAAPPEAAPAGLPPEWRRYLGKYRNIWGDSQVLMANGGLALINPTEQDLGGMLLHMTPEGEHTFRLSGKNGYAAVGELALFELDSDGAVVRLKVGENYTYPLNGGDHA
jgi:CubicO group peptidase (beta-lactamase class C family)